MTYSDALYENKRGTSEGVTCLRSLQMLHNNRFRMRTPKGTPKGSSDLWSHSGKNRACAEHTSGQGRFQIGPLPIM
jgi:hypothetical protein